ncbi:hypothetical protein P872_22285 [Rhodonellum psychrophilum GCM71 = DSM 17998]|uniref:Type I restriction modification DNA specificity domain-containing protein n=2 Tax=Rhodonellum TaxID=336827 RepID=U5BUB1_9BACT|nr:MULTISPECIES: restriction endonuclease subunit S [Rhodonellum]ERM80176.1 hypothetical protein P872_22285 [Rhodonellum psychrophilum GCM71 = DSM 17998]SDZ59437.1 type I restriction enzyme, S subunit [Rhodonellum ikkaensis]
MRANWIEVELGEIFETVTGNTPPKNDPQNYGGKIPFVKPPEVTNRPISKAVEFLSEKGAKRSRLLPKGSILVTCIGNLGRVGLSKNQVAFNQQINAIKPLTGIDSSFTFYQAQSPKFKNQLDKLSSATTVPIVNKGKFNTILFHIAPLPEQRAIVAQIEELFSELDHSISNLKSAQAKLEIYRQAVLKKAFEGGYSKSNPQENFVRLEEVSDAIGGFAFKSGDFKKERFKYQVIRIGNIRPGVIRLNESPIFLDKLDSKTLSKAQILKGDVLITLTGTRKKRDYGFTAFVEGHNLLLNQRVAALRFGEKYYPKFFLYFSWTDFFKDQFFGSETGNVGQGNVGMKSIRETLVPFCGIDVQTQIVQEIESRLSVADKMAETIHTSLQKAEALRQSILKKAFEGKLLTEAELEACRKEADWEPAEKLLERIKSEKKK